MKNSIKIVLIILTLVALILPITHSYATEGTFFEISKLEVVKGEKIEMTINLDEIGYTKFIFELESNENVENVELSEESNETVEIETNNNEIVIEIDKNSTNLNTITLYYEVPDTVEVDDVIKFVATITNTENDEDTKVIQSEVKIIEQEYETNTDVQEIHNQMYDNKNAQSDINTTSTMQVSGTNTVSTTSKNAEETVTYNGSDNNYLSELSVNGYTLNKKFSKDKSTYFLTVENDINSLDITATATEDTATVSIYGNEDLTQGTNKILISVVAENGNVRNYRIYVTKNS